MNVVKRGVQFMYTVVLNRARNDKLLETVEPGACVLTNWEKETEVYWRLVDEANLAPNDDFSWGPPDLLKS